MKSVKLSSGDLEIVSGRSSWVTERACVAQRIENSIRLDKGSWFLGPLSGIDWFAIYEAKAVSERMVRGNIERILKKDPEVTRIEFLTIGFDTQERKITVNFSVSTKYGSIEGEI